MLRQVVLEAVEICLHGLHIDGRQHCAGVVRLECGVVRLDTNKVSRECRLVEVLMRLTKARLAFWTTRSISTWLISMASRGDPCSRSKTLRHSPM
jgi:hypothetical protein